MLDTAIGKIVTIWFKIKLFGNIFMKDSLKISNLIHKNNYAGYTHSIQIQNKLLFFIKSIKDYIY